jgi:hypothetical protein
MIKHVWLKMQISNAPEFQPQFHPAEFSPDLWPKLTTLQVIPPVAIANLEASLVEGLSFNTIYMTWKMDPCPNNEMLTLTFPNLTAVDLKAIESVQVITTCPEQGAIVLMAIGLAASARYRYRRTRRS